jgi:hypothetical protein
VKIIHAKCFAAVIGICLFVANTYYFDPALLMDSLLGYGLCFFFLFLYLNPAMLLARSMKELDEVWENAKGLPFAWIAVATGIFGGVMSFF